MIKIKIGGVPEHFNLPWTLALQEGLFLKYGIELQWIEYPGGTGAMCADLRNETLDLAVLLTEGITADIIKGNPSKIIKWYVQSPLYWGIHVAAASPYYSMAELQGKKYAISRMGSGSHLMAHVDAAFRSWKLNDAQFVLVGDLKGALQSLGKGESDIFLWEQLMTKPYVEKGLLRKIDERPTPWPCFALAGRTGFIANQQQAVLQIVDVVNGFEQRMRLPDVAERLAIKYGFEEEDVATWLHKTRWCENNVIEREAMKEVIQSLFSLGIIHERKDPSELISQLTVMTE